MNILVPGIYIPDNPAIKFFTTKCQPFLGYFILNGFELLLSFCETRYERLNYPIT